MGTVWAFFGAEAKVQFCTVCRNCTSQKKMSADGNKVDDNLGDTLDEGLEDDLSGVNGKEE